MRTTCAALLIAVCAHAQEIRVEIPDDPFLVADTQLAELVRLAAGPGEGLFAPRVARLFDEIEALNRTARAHRDDALALQGEIDAFRPEIAAFDEEKARFEETCRAPATKEAEAMCRAWAARLEERRAALQGRRKELADTAHALAGALDAHLVRPRGALEKRIADTRRQIEDFLESARERREQGHPLGRAAAVEGDVFHMTPGGPARVRAETVIGSRSEIWTGPGGSVRIVLPGGTELLVGPESHVTFEELEPEGALARIWHGIVRLAGTKDAEQLKVRGPTCTVARRGTDFIAEVTTDGRFSVTVLEGAVVCTPDGGGAPVELTAPHRIEVAPDGAFGPVTRVDPAAAELVWKAIAGAGASAAGTDAAPRVPVAMIAAAVVLVFLVLLAAALRRRRA